MVNMVGDRADMSEWRDRVSRKCTVAVDAQAQSMCSPHSEPMHPGQKELPVAPRSLELRPPTWVIPSAGIVFLGSELFGTP